jgi:hypothetical protein
MLTLLIFAPWARRTSRTRTSEEQKRKPDARRVEVDKTLEKHAYWGIVFRGGRAALSGLRRDRLEILTPKKAARPCSKMTAQAAIVVESRPSGAPARAQNCGGSLAERSVSASDRRFSQHPGCDQLDQR